MIVAFTTEVSGEPGAGQLEEIDHVEDLAALVVRLI